MISVSPGDPLAPEASALLDASHALMRSLFSAEDNHFLGHEALRAPDIRFFVARENDETLGCGALRITPDYGEVKSFFTKEEARSRGVGTAILSRIEAEALRLGLPELKLETGNVLHAAHRLYASQGFRLCGPFGSYEASPASVFMEKPLAT